MATSQPTFNTPFASVCPGCGHSLLNHRNGRCIVQRGPQDNRICGCKSHLEQLHIPYQIAPTQQVPE